MRNLLIGFVALCGFTLCSTMTVSGQSTNDKVYSTYDQAPVPPGGNDGYRAYLEKNIKYPAEAIKAKVNGTVYISIVVGKDGTLSDVHIEKDHAGYGCGEEAVRVIKDMPAWTPGKMNGVPVKVRYMIPVKFSRG